MEGPSQNDSSSTRPDDVMDGVWFLTKGGEGVPQWFSALATPGEIGKPLHPLPKQKDGKWEVQECSVCKCAKNYNMKCQSVKRDHGLKQLEMVHFFVFLCEAKLFSSLAKQASF